MTTRTPTPTTHTPTASRRVAIQRLAYVYTRTTRQPAPASFTHRRITIRCRTTTTITMPCRRMVNTRRRAAVVITFPWSAPPATRRRKWAIRRWATTPCIRWRMWIRTMRRWDWLCNLYITFIILSVLSGMHRDRQRGPEWSLNGIRPVHVHQAPATALGDHSHKSSRTADSYTLNARPNDTRTRSRRNARSLQPARAERCEL